MKVPCSLRSSKSAPGSCWVDRWNSLMFAEAGTLFLDICLVVRRSAYGVETLAARRLALLLGVQLVNTYLHCHVPDFDRH